MLLDQINSQTMIAVVDKEDKTYEKEYHEAIVKWGKSI
jgi:hypothetical protein